ncbi:MAG: serine aminopeptidase domain-containing protein [Acidimicrobiales bacterium]
MGVAADDWETSSLSPFLGPSGDGHEEIELFGESELLFGCRNVPAAGASSGVVICPPTGSDAEVNYHREARLGRWLARAGVTVQRYHPRGSGRSEGRSADVSFASLVDDARRAADLLRERCGVDQVAFLGTRAGALVAARACREMEGAPLALWQPVVDPRRYVDESVAVGAPLLETHLGRDLFDSAAVDNLVDMLGVRPRPVLLVQLHRRVGLSSEYRATVGRWQARGFTVEVAYDPTEDDWWRVHPGWEPSDEVLTVTALWLASRLAAAGR